MKSIKNRKGFVASAVLYVMLGLFISLMISVVLIYANRKVMLDKMEDMVSDKLEQDNKVEHQIGDRNEYYEAARAYMKTNSKFNNFKEDKDVSFIAVNSLIREGLLPESIVSPLTNKKEVTQKNYVVVVVNGDDYSFSYVDESAAVDYISVINELKKDVESLKDASGTGGNLLNKTYPVGSIYITTNYTTATSVANVLGGTWEAYGSGRTLVGVNTSDSNFNTVSKTGGSSTNTLTTANLPAHTHSIPALSGSTNSAGSHMHDIYGGWGSGNSSGVDAITYAQGTNDRMYRNSMQGVSPIISASGAHTHNITTNASTSGSTGSTTAFTNLQPYITVYMYKRIG